MISLKESAPIDSSAAIALALPKLASATNVLKMMREQGADVDRTFWPMSELAAQYSSQRDREADAQKLLEILSTLASAGTIRVDRQLAGATASIASSCGSSGVKIEMLQKGIASMNDAVHLLLTLGTITGIEPEVDERLLFAAWKAVDRAIGACFDHGGPRCEVDLLELRFELEKAIAGGEHPSERLIAALQVKAAVASMYSNVDEPKEVAASLVEGVRDRPLASVALGSALGLPPLVAYPGETVADVLARYANDRKRIDELRRSIIERSA